MLNKYRDWYRSIDDESLLVLKHPEMAAQVKGRVRRLVARNLSTLTPIERQQLHDFLLKYRGAGFYIAAFKLMLLFSAIGVALHLLLPQKLELLKALAFSNGMGFALAWGMIGVWFNYRSSVRHKLKKLLLIVSMCAAGVATGVLLAGLSDTGSMGMAFERLLRVGGVALLVAVVFYMVPLAIVTSWRNRQYEALTRQLQQDAERDRLARELSESQLRLLRAQIEPHFLFNTLGAVQQLAEQGAPGAARAAALTADLIAFLRASLAEMRSEQVPLQSEFEMVAAYLRVMQARMGARLRYALDLPAECAHAVIPSMILLTLAENAIKHGIEPSLRGGEVILSARHVDGMLRLRVRDTGMGLPQGETGLVPEGGLGLENVRSRLQLCHPCASLDVRDGEDGGVIAEILLPITIASSLTESAA
ncbi:sensor histidine kinase [Janthinobacterium psychrotolerans]|uniref:Sensor histidine kinase YesM n=1 Tax=Janthinobacterium psychrotolerans TaxID=1747903 RepID=A0A1A7C4P2_9BURK|nr:histidine kinase [Janthinobacterium psychrotolerans]OBV40886.1 Sensor histidine kinase YesM [Janthinobacterium psychrotolerans]